MRSLILAALCCTLSAHDPWTVQDTVMEGIFIATLAIDRAQTLDIKNHPDKFEGNVFLGNHPTDRRINRHFLTVALLHPAICYALPRNARTGFQFVSITVQAYTIGNNFSIGLRCKF